MRPTAPAARWKATKKRTTRKYAPASGTGMKSRATGTASAGCFLSEAKKPRQVPTGPFPTYRPKIWAMVKTISLDVPISERDGVGDSTSPNSSSRIWGLILNFGPKKVEAKRKVRVLPENQ